MSNRTFRRLSGSVALVLVMLAVVALAATSAFAWSPATDTATTGTYNATTNPLNPNNAGGSLSGNTLRVGSALTVVSNYTFASQAFPAGGAQIGSRTSLRVLYQQWRHDAQNNWFYLYAVNSAASQVGPTWDFYYYAPIRGATRVAGSAAGGVATTQFGAATFVYVSSDTTAPAFILESLNVTTEVCGAAVAVGANCPTVPFSSTLRWGVAQQGFRTNSGTQVSLLQSVETFPNADPSIAGVNRVYYDAWEPVVSGTTVALSNTAPTQAADSTGLSNGTGARQVNSSVAYNSTQVSGDINGDLLSHSVIWVGSGAKDGQWFEAGSIFGRSTGGESVTGSRSFYRSWNESMVTTANATQMTNNYFTSLTVTSTLTTSNTDAGRTAQTGLTSASTAYAYVYASGAVGTWGIQAYAGDYHGAQTQAVIGSQVIS